MCPICLASLALAAAAKAGVATGVVATTTKLAKSLKRTANHARTSAAGGGR